MVPHLYDQVMALCGVVLEFMGPCVSEESHGHLIEPVYHADYMTDFKSKHQKEAQNTLE